MAVNINKLVQDQKKPKLKIPPIKIMLSSEKEVKNASDKNYQQESSCQFCQATGLLPGLEPQDLPDLTASINVWSVSD